MLEQPGAMKKKHGEMRQTEFVLSREPELMVFKSAGQNFVLACDCKAALLKLLQQGSCIRAYKVLGLLPDAAIYATVE